MITLINTKREIQSVTLSRKIFCANYKSERRTRNKYFVQNRFIPIRSSTYVSFRCTTAPTEGKEN